MRFYCLPNKKFRSINFVPHQTTIYKFISFFYSKKLITNLFFREIIFTKIFVKLISRKIYIKKFVYRSMKVGGRDYIKKLEKKDYFLPIMFKLTKIYIWTLKKHHMFAQQVLIIFILMTTKKFMKPSSDGLVTSNWNFEPICLIAQYPPKFYFTFSIYLTIMQIVKWCKFSTQFFLFLP